MEFSNNDHLETSNSIVSSRTEKTVLPLPVLNNVQIILARMSKLEQLELEIRAKIMSTQPPNKLKGVAPKTSPFTRDSLSSTTEASAEVNQKQTIT